MRSVENSCLAGQKVGIGLAIIDLVVTMVGTEPLQKRVGVSKLWNACRKSRKWKGQSQGLTKTTQKSEKKENCGVRGGGGGGGGAARGGGGGGEGGCNRLSIWKLLGDPNHLTLSSEGNGL